MRTAKRVDRIEEFLEREIAGCQRGLDRWSSVPRSSRNETVASNIAYWRNGISILKAALGNYRRSKEFRRKRKEA